jgi:hypothetical protein
MAHEITYEFEEIEVEKDGVTYVCYGVCNVEYEIVSEFHLFDGKRLDWPEIQDYSRFKIRICDVDGKDLEYLDCDSDHPYAKMIIAKFDEDFIVELCTKDHEG